ncbi:MAG: hypothetical protein NC293_09050 [Roseburia sp.]|nr:hypothetical protein [Roseburia sp.]
MGNTKFPRKAYDNIKKMDHNTMHQYINQIYTRGYTEGRASVCTMSDTELKEVILSVKGVGETKATSIVSAIREHKERKGLTDGGKEEGILGNA